MNDEHAPGEAPQGEWKPDPIPAEHSPAESMLPPPPPLPNQAKKPVPVPEPEPTVPAEPAVMPHGLFKQVDYCLHHPESILESLRQRKDLWSLTRVFLAITIVMSATYGVIMGGTNWFQGTDMPALDQMLFMIATGVKVPVLFLLSLLIVISAIYVSSMYVGVRLQFDQLVALLLASQAMTTITLASMASVAFFFALTTLSYNFIKLLHVAFFAYAGLVGMMFLLRCFRQLVGRKPRSRIFLAWIALYAFVGMQLAWTLRPFVGWPGMEFELFRPKEGNFYESVINSLLAML